MTVDLVMWTKNGAGTLPKVLQRIGEVVPATCVGQRLIVDDSSVDGTMDIAKRFGWNVVANEGKGVSDGANTALKNVESNLFCSFEQDLLLSQDWWTQIPKQITDSKVAVACGMRFADRPRGLVALQKYVARKYRGEPLSSWLRTRELSAFTFGKTLDNTIYRADVLRGIGGFPKLSVNAGVDSVLAYRIAEAGYDWNVDYNVQSVHLRRGLSDELSHQYWYGTQLNMIWNEIKTMGVPPPLSRLGVLQRFCLSPLTGLFIALKTGEPSTSIIHPLLRWAYLRGLLEAD